MAIGINSIFEIRSGATSANANGGLFNPERTGTLNDLAATSSSGQSSTPTVSSVSYTFTATDGDGTCWLFIQSGGTFVPGWYLITSVSAGVATLSAGVGAAIKYTTYANGRSLALNTATGCATTTTPTSGVFMIDYSQRNGAIIAGSTDFGSTTIAPTTLNSATGGFTQAMVGNGFHQITTGTGAFGLLGWYEIVTVTDANNLVLDRTPNSGTASVGCTGSIGGAISLQSNSVTAGLSDDAVFENGLGTNGSGATMFFIKNGTYTQLQSITVAAVGGTLAPIKVFGYNSIRTDGLGANLGTNRPTINLVATAVTWAANWERYNIIETGTTSSMDTIGAANKVVHFKVTNSSITNNRYCFSCTNTLVPFFEDVEAMSYRGLILDAVSGATPINMDSCYFHSSAYVSNDGYTSSQRILFTNCIFADMFTGVINFAGVLTTALPTFLNCTFYGAENKLGVGINVATTGTAVYFRNCIFYGLVTPVVYADLQTVTGGFSNYNNYYNNTNSNTNYPLGSNSLALDPQFSNVVQRTGTTATTNTTLGNHLVDANATFVTWGITAGVDTVYISSGPGVVFTNYSILSVDSETQLTVGETILADATANHVWQITTGHNFNIGTNLKAQGFPGVFPGALTTGYMDVGAAQRQEQSSGGAGGFFIQ